MSVVAQAKLNLNTLKAEIAALQGQIAGLTAQISSVTGGVGGSGANVGPTQDPLGLMFDYPKSPASAGDSGLSWRRGMSIAHTVNSMASVVTNWNLQQQAKNQYLTSAQQDLAAQQAAQASAVQGLVSQGLSTVSYIAMAASLAAAGPVGWGVGAFLLIGGAIQGAGWYSAITQAQDAYTKKSDDHFSYAMWRAANP
jgi:hypothetical protein